MYPNQALYISIHPGFIRMTKKFSYSKQRNWDHLIWKWDNFFILTPMIFIQNPGDSPLLYVSKSCFVHRDSYWFWLKWWKSYHIPKQENWVHLIWKWNNFIILNPKILIQLPGGSPLLYVTKSIFVHCDLSWFDLNDEEVVIFPNKKTWFTWFESEITSSS